MQAENATVGRNNEAIEQVVLRLSLADDVTRVSRSIAESAIAEKLQPEKGSGIFFRDYLPEPALSILDWASSITALARA